MPNKRTLKKQIKYICGDLAAECMIATDYVPGVDRDAMFKCVAEIAALQTGALANSTFSFDKVPSDFATVAEYHKARRAYYKAAYTALREKFNDKINSIVKAMNAAVPQKVKDANKAK